MSGKSKRKIEIFWETRQFDDFFLFSGTFQEQQKLCNDAAGTTLYSYRFRQRSTVLKRYYIAQCRNGQKASAASDQVDSEDYSNLEKIKKKEAKVQGTQGLARYKLQLHI